MIIDNGHEDQNLMCIKWFMKVMATDDQKELLKYTKTVNLRLLHRFKQKMSIQSKPKVHIWVGRGEQIIVIMNNRPCEKNFTIYFTNAKN